MDENGFPNSPFEFEFVDDIDEDSYESSDDSSANSTNEEEEEDVVSVEEEYVSDKDDDIEQKDQQQQQQQQHQQQQQQRMFGNQMSKPQGPVGMMPSMPQQSLPYSNMGRPQNPASQGISSTAGQQDNFGMGGMQQQGQIRMPNNTMGNINNSMASNISSVPHTMGVSTMPSLPSTAGMTQSMPNLNNASQMGGTMGGAIGGPQSVGSVMSGPQSVGSTMGGPQSVGSTMGGPQSVGGPHSVGSSMGGPQSVGNAMGGPQSVGGAISGPQGGQAALPGPDQGNNPLQNRNIIWKGQLEWQDKKTVMQGPSARITRSLGCMVSIARTDQDINTGSWPSMLIMQLMPQTLLNSSQLHPLFKNSRQVVFHFHNTNLDDLRNLYKVMGSGFAGCVHFPPSTACDIRVLLLLFSNKRKSFVGLIPNDQSGVVNGIRQVITQHKQGMPMNLEAEKHLYKEMKNFINSEEFSDVKVKVGSEIFRCHKVILASGSAYFRGLFTSGMAEMQKGVVELKAIEEAEFRDVLKIMYTGQCEINKYNVQGLIYAASYLQMPSVVEERCSDFMMDSSRLRNSRRRNLQHLKIGRHLSLQTLTQRIIFWIATDFPKYKDLDEFWTETSSEDIKDLIQVGLKTESEDEVCSVVLRWIDSDKEARKQYVNELVKLIHYLALTNDYMKNSFLEHPVIKESLDLENVRQKCREYLENPRKQFEYIGEREASHRKEHKYRDVIAVCYPTSIEFMEFIEGKDGLFTLVKSDYKTTRNLDEYCAKTMMGRHNPNITNITACNYGRSELVISTGVRLYHYSGLTGCWTPGPVHLKWSDNNCLLHDSKTDNIYSIVADEKKIIIERCKLNSEQESNVWHMEVLRRNEYEHGERSSQDLGNIKNRTCAYMIDENIFFLKPVATKSQTETSLFRYNTITKSMGIISSVPVPFVCTVAVPYKDLVFLVDITGRHILRVSEKGHCIEPYGEIGHDNPTLIKGIRHNFGACIYGGRLVTAGGYCDVYSSVLSTEYVDYDLNMHTTTRYTNRFQNEAAVCLKLTVNTDQAKFST